MRKPYVTNKFCNSWECNSVDEKPQIEPQSSVPYKQKC